MFHKARTEAERQKIFDEYLLGILKKKKVIKTNQKIIDESGFSFDPDADNKQLKGAFNNYVDTLVVKNYMIEQLQTRLKISKSLSTQFVNKLNGNQVLILSKNLNDFIKYVDDNHNNILENNIDFGAHSESGNALIIKNIPLTNINDIQSIVYYNRSGEDRSIGLVLELYNTLNDTDLIYSLASSNVISTYSLLVRYRFDFPSISSYSGFADENSINEIVNDTIALTETISLYNIEMTGNVSMNNDLSIGGSLFLGDTNLTEDIDKLLTLDTNKRLTINGLTSGFVKTGEVNSDYLNTTFQGKFGIPDSGNDLTLSGTQINFNSDSFISNTAGGNSGNHLVVFVNGTEYKIKLENAS